MPYVGRQSLNPWTTRGVPKSVFYEDEEFVFFTAVNSVPRTVPGTYWVDNKQELDEGKLTFTGYLRCSELCLEHFD